MEIHWEKLCSGGLGRFYDITESSRRRARRAQWYRLGVAITVAIVVSSIALAVRWQ